MNILRNLSLLSLVMLYVAVDVKIVSSVCTMCCINKYHCMLTHTHCLITGPSQKQLERVQIILIQNWYQCEQLPLEYTQT